MYWKLFHYNYDSQKITVTNLLVEEWGDIYKRSSMTLAKRRALKQTENRVASEFCTVALLLHISYYHPRTRQTEEAELADSQNISPFQTNFMPIMYTCTVGSLKTIDSCKLIRSFLVSDQVFWHIAAIPQPIPPDIHPHINTHKN